MLLSVLEAIRIINNLFQVTVDWANTTIHAQLKRCNLMKRHKAYDKLTEHSLSVQNSGGNN